MSKTLLNKINNILDIDITAAYINLFHYQSNMIPLLNYHSLNVIRQNWQNNTNIEIVINENYRDILEACKKINTFTEMLPIFEQHAILISEEQISKFTNSHDYFLCHKKELYEQVEQTLLAGTLPFYQLKELAFKTFIEEGKQMLSLTDDLLVGNINEVSFNAPIFVRDIDIDITDNNHIAINFTSEPYLNEKLILALSKELKVDPCLFLDANLKSVTDFQKVLEPIIQYSLQVNDQLPLASHYQNIPLTIVPQRWIGIFDIKPGKIKTDFLELMHQNVELLNDKMIHDIDYYIKQEFETDALIQINNPLNIYQKYALRSAVNENTLIYGPPGTGKSEIITSLIANLLIKDKTILVISEKDAALEVIKQRLNNLSLLVFYLRDISDEKLFYGQIELLARHMGSFFNEETLSPSFDLAQMYAQNERVCDYNREINKLRKVLQEQIDFYVDKDSSGNDYKDYLTANATVNQFVETHEDDITSYFTEYKNHYPRLQTPTAFIAKVAQYNQFRTRHQLSEEDVKTFDKERHELNKFKVAAGLDYTAKETYIQTHQKVQQLQEFINEQMLHKDAEFNEKLLQDPFFFYKNWENWQQIEKLLEAFPKESLRIKRFLIAKQAKHAKLLITYVSSSSYVQKELLKRYYYKGDVNKKGCWKKHKSDAFYQAFYQCIKLFDQITPFKNNTYLLSLHKYDSAIFHPEIVYYYTHPQLLKPSFVEFVNHEVVAFDQRILNQYYFKHINAIERELTNINTYNSEKYSEKRHIIERDIPYLIDNYLKHNADFIINMDKVILDICLRNIKHKLSSAPQELQMKMHQMFQVLGMERKPKINDFIVNYIDCLKLIYPVWISKPAIMCHYYPLEAKVFDVGIFDEASQMFLEKAYPLIYRCQQLVIAGDNKQLKPERTPFNQLHKSSIMDAPSVAEIDFNTSESLLDRARVSYWNTFTLRNHYRSMIKELIDFSNFSFYDGKLIFVSKNHTHNLSLDVIDSKGKEENGINNEEIKLLMRTIKDHINRFVEYNITNILVICYTSAQKELLIKKILKEANPIIKQWIHEKKLVIKDISNVQGDEGDVVIISNVFSSQSPNYGVLSAMRGQNYLNVAITRAKKKMIILKSLTFKQVVNDSSLDQEALQCYRSWIHYLDELKINPAASLTPSHHKVSFFKQEIYETLKTHPDFKFYEILEHVNLGSLAIDIAFKCKGSSHIDLILILDDWKKNLTFNEWFEDIDQQEYLTQRNYQVLRIEEINWMQNKEGILEQIKNILPKSSIPMSSTRSKGKIQKKTKLTNSQSIKHPHNRKKGGKS